MVALAVRNFHLANHPIPSNQVEDVFAVWFLVHFATAGHYVGLRRICRATHGASAQHLSDVVCARPAR